MEMDKVIVAFESPKSCERVREIIESSGTAACIICRSAAEVKRTVSKHHISTVVCGFKLPDESAQSLFEDLPPNCAMLMVAVQGMLDLCQNDDIFLLASPVSRGDLVASVRMLIQMGHRLEKFVRPQLGRGNGPDRRGQVPPDGASRHDGGAGPSFSAKKEHGLRGQNGPDRKAGIRRAVRSIHIGRR